MPLTPTQRSQFLSKGWIRVENAVPESHLSRFADDVWVRLGYDPEDKGTWVKEKIHMPRHRQIPTKEFAPKAWEAICELVGGEDKIDPTLFESCGDSLIVNLGSEEWGVDQVIDPRNLGNWHVDGDWFTHFLDSGEQALTVIVLFNDIQPRAGGTFIAPDGIAKVCQWLYEHPEGADSWPMDETGSRTVCDIQNCNEFVELTGKRGDVIIFHPFMPHSASKNFLRIPRFITNPPVTLKEPFNLNRDNPDDYSLVELKILTSLNLPPSSSPNSSLGLPNWHITSPRKRFTPRTRAGKDALILEELARMKAWAVKMGRREDEVDSMHRDGVVAYQTVVARAG